MHISLLEIHMAVLKRKRGDGPVAIEMNVFFEEGWEAVVRLHAVECPVYVFGDRAGGFDGEDVGFEARGLVEALEEGGVGEFYRVAGAFAVDIAGWC